MSRAEVFAAIFAALALAQGLGFAIQYASQPILEAHGFRQTQTALSTYWLEQNGFRFAYETPVLGAPWSIPFEFPIYQGIAAAIHRLAGGSLEVVGRLLSFSFLLACIWPARMIQTRLGLSRTTLWVFVGLLLASPQYLFWGRTFMIETTALFFSLLCIPPSIDLMRRRPSGLPALCLCMASTAALLTKVTTGLPVIAVMCLLWVVQSRKSPRLVWRDAVLAALAFGLPVLVAWAWIAYTDSVKSLSALGVHLTSANLRAWNFGTLAQRVSPQFWIDVVWKRCLVGNAGGLAGLVLVIGSLRTPQNGQRRTQISVAVALALFLLPLLAFTNLQIVHDYYQTGCTVFLIAAISMAAGEWLPLASGASVSSPATMAFLIIWSGMQFNLTYAEPMARRWPGGHPTLAVAEFLRAHTSPEQPIVVYGLEWSSELAFYSRRKALTIPSGAPERQRTWSNPETFLGGVAPGAIVIYPRALFPSEAQIAQKLAGDKLIEETRIQGCRILLSGRRGST